MSWSSNARVALAATEDPAEPGQTLEYHPVILGPDGTASRQSLEVLVASLRPEVQDPRTQIVVMVHGFKTTLRRGTSEYRDLARRLGREADTFGLKLALVGVHWSSNPGPGRSWLPQAFLSRVTSLLGFHHAVKNPYLAKVRLARQAGRTGLRSVLFRLQDEFPAVPLHLFVHSLGAQMLVSALAPGAAETDHKEGSIEQPDRIPQVGLVALAGADLDEDVFARRATPAVRLALCRARVWWVTVPEQGKADGVLELRRGAGRGDALGNRGLKLEQEDLDRLLARGALVVDEGNVPTWHDFTDYYNDRRLKALAVSLVSLQQPSAPAARKSTLAALNVVLTSDPEALGACTAVHDASIRLYSSWRLHLHLSESDHVKIVDDKSAASGSAMALRLENLALRAPGEKPHCPALFDIDELPPHPSRDTR